MRKKLRQNLILRAFALVPPKVGNRIGGAPASRPPSPYLKGKAFIVPYFCLPPYIQGGRWRAVSPERRDG